MEGFTPPPRVSPFGGEGRAFLSFLGGRVVVALSFALFSVADSVGRGRRGGAAHEAELIGLGDCAAIAMYIPIEVMTACEGGKGSDNSKICSCPGVAAAVVWRGFCGLNRVRGREKGTKPDHERCGMGCAAFFFLWEGGKKGAHGCACHAGKIKAK